MDLPVATLMQMFQVLFIGIIVLYTLVAGIFDLRTRRIPNYLTVPVFVLALAAHTANGGLAGLIFSLLGFAAGFGILFVLWLFGGGGGGDVKMMGALGAWLGPKLTIQVFLVSALAILFLAGGALLFSFVTQGFLTMRRRYLSGGDGGRPSPRSGARRRWRSHLVPYAVPVAVSTWVVLAIAWKTGTLP